MTVPEGYFNIKRDNSLIAAGSHFWCEACVVARPLVEQSPDPRYCQGCYEVLEIEAELLPASKRPQWIPKSLKIGQQKAIPVPQDVVLNMHTVNGEKNKVCIIQSVTPKVTLGKRRGPKHRDLPVELITQWAGEGMGSKAIATQLKKEFGIMAHYSTIQRILSGQRVMV